MSDSAAEELPADVRPAREPRKRSGFWRELSGALAFGLCALAVVVLGFQIVAAIRGTPGPGAFTVIGHLAAAALAVLAQLFADRRRDWVGTAAMVAVYLVGGVALWIFWWA